MSYADDGDLDRLAETADLWPCDGPHSTETVIDAARAISALVRYIHNATSTPRPIPYMSPDAGTATAQLICSGCLSSGQGEAPPGWVLGGASVVVVDHGAGWACSRRLVRLICAGWLPQDGAVRLERFRWSSIERHHQDPL